MVNHGIIYGSSIPPAVKITPKKVFVHSNVEAIEREEDGRSFTDYQYNCIEYTTEEYLTLQNNRIVELEEELTATKILLGVE